MTTLVHTDSRDFQASKNKSLVSTRAFNEEFYTYTVSTNALGVTRGVFSVVNGATATTCPGRRILHLTGRKLYPDVNPMDTFVGTALTAKKFLVAVYDPISFLTGFIDPTSNTFAKYDQNLPNFFNLGNSGSGIQWSSGGAGAELGALDAGTSPATNHTGTFNAGYASVGQVDYTGNGGTVNGAQITVTSSAVKSTSKIFVSFASNAGGTQTSLWVSDVANGSFIINSYTGACVITFLIIN
jgi:hypothetical protein